MLSLKVAHHTRQLLEQAGNLCTGCHASLRAEGLPIKPPDEEPQLLIIVPIESLSKTTVFATTLGPFFEARDVVGMPLLSDSSDDALSCLMTVWIVASNHATYRSEDAFRELEEVNWSETPGAHIALGDIVYLYITRPVSAIGIKCSVTAVGLPEPDIDDRDYWVDEKAMLERMKRRSWMHLKRIAVFSEEQRAQLKGTVLERHGLRGGRVPGRRRAPDELLAYIEFVEHGGTITGDDAIAEAGEFEPSEVSRFVDQIMRGDYAVRDQTVPAKTRGSAQQAFAQAVKSNYNWHCAITGISTREFLVASHIVPWSEAPGIRLDPSNGICLSTFVDRAFDAGFLRIGTDYVVRINWMKVGDDKALKDALEPFDGRHVVMPTRDMPQQDYLRRRLA